MKTFTLSVVLSASAASCVLAGPAEVPVLFTNVVFTSGSTNVFVAGSIPQLGNWDPRFSVKLANSSGVWRATIGIPEGADFKYKFIRRATSPDSAYGDINNVTKEPGPDRAGSTPPGPPAPYEGKTIFYYSRWSNVSLLYSNTLVGWTNQPMIAVGPGRTNLFAGEQIWRADSINSAGDTNLQFAFYTTIAGTNVYDNAGQPVDGYQSPLDAMVVQDGQIYNYWPPPTVSTSRVLLIPANAAFNPTNGLTARALRVYLPRGYDQNTTKRYPVLYMHDGQNVFIAQYAGCCGCWYSDTNADNLIRFGKMRETIIVGVANSADRTCEYSPPSCPFGCTVRGDQYVSWIADRIRPYINARDWIG